MLAPTPYSGSLYRGLRIGLLGGSFNPAHDGHRHIALLALRRLRLNRVWWLVSPQNPLKPTDGMAPFAERLASAQRMARHPRMVATDLEARLGTRYTADTLAALRRRFPGTRFVWIMGSDNLRQMPSWERWGAIFASADIAVFARPPYAPAMLSGRAAHRFRKTRISPRAFAWLGGDDAAGWSFFHTRRLALSATELRSRGLAVAPAQERHAA